MKGFLKGDCRVPVIVFALILSTLLAAAYSFCACVFVDRNSVEIGPDGDPVISLMPPEELGENDGAFVTRVRVPASEVPGDGTVTITAGDNPPREVEILERPAGSSDPYRYSESLIFVNSQSALKQRFQKRVLYDGEDGWLTSMWSILPKIGDDVSHDAVLVRPKGAFARAKWTAKYPSPAIDAAKYPFVSLRMQVSKPFSGPNHKLKVFWNSDKNVSGADNFKVWKIEEDGVMYNYAFDVSSCETFLANLSKMSICTDDIFSRVEVEKIWIKNTDGTEVLVDDFQGKDLIWSKMSEDCKDIALNGGLLIAEADTIKRIVSSKEPAKRFGISRTWGEGKHIDASKAKYLMVRMQVGKWNPVVKFCWGDGAYSKDIEVHEDGRAHEYIVDLSADKNWNGSISSFTILSSDGPGYDLDIDRVEVRSAAHGVQRDFGEGPINYFAVSPGQTITASYGGAEVSMRAVFSMHSPIIFPFVASHCTGQSPIETKIGIVSHMDTSAIPGQYVDFHAWQADGKYVGCERVPMHNDQLSLNVGDLKMIKALGPAPFFGWILAMPSVAWADGSAIMSHSDGERVLISDAVGIPDSSIMMVDSQGNIIRKRQATPPNGWEREEPLTSNVGLNLLHTTLVFPFVNTASPAETVLAICNTFNAGAIEDRSVDFYLYDKSGKFVSKYSGRFKPATGPGRMTEMCIVRVGELFGEACRDGGLVIAHLNVPKAYGTVLYSTDGKHFISATRAEIDNNIYGVDTGAEDSTNAPMRVIEPRPRLSGSK